MTSRQSRLQVDTYFRVMSILLENPKLTQRELASKLGLSLGGLNYCLRALIDKGFVKMENFKKAENKLKFVYLITPKGIKEKSKLTYRFLERKLQEYEVLKTEIDELKGLMQNLDCEGSSYSPPGHLGKVSQIAPSDH